jgi:hypothetical protein
LPLCSLRVGRRGRDRHHPSAAAPGHRFAPPFLRRRADTARPPSSSPGGRRRGWRAPPQPPPPPPWARVPISPATFQGDGATNVGPPPPPPPDSIFRPLNRTSLVQDKPSRIEGEVGRARGAPRCGIFFFLVLARALEAPTRTGPERAATAALSRAHCWDPDLAGRGAAGQVRARV